MKKNVKRWCMVGGILMFIGIILTIFAVKSGAKTVISWVDGKIKVGQEIISLEKSSIEEFHSIETELQSSNIELIASDGYYIEIRECVGHLEYKIVNGVLKIEQKDKSFFGIGFRGDKENKVRIYYPEEVVLEDASFKIDIGSLNMEEVNVSSLKINCDMGSVGVKKSFSNELLIEADMGNVNLENIVVNTIDVNADMGNVEIKNIDLSEKGTVECNMGNVEISFEKSVESYQIYAKINMGELFVDGKKYNSYNTEGEIPVEISSDMGNIELNFGK